MRNSQMQHYSPLSAHNRHVIKLIERAGLQFPRYSSSELIWFFLSLSRADRQSHPGSLVLVGPPGGGKTTMVESLAATMGVHVLRFSLADCESAYAGNPSAALRNLAKQAERLEEQGLIVVIVIEDAECGFGLAQDNQASTTNLTQLQGTLQELMDGTHVIDGRLLKPKRFVLTANTTNFKRSQLREGRCVVVEHNPSTLDRIRIAETLLIPVLPRRVLSGQMRRIASLTIAEIAALKAELRRRVDTWIALDMAWSAYQVWLVSARGPDLTDAVARRLLRGRDVRQAVRVIHQRSKVREAYL